MNTARMTIEVEYESVGETALPSLVAKALADAGISGKVSTYGFNSLPPNARWFAESYIPDPVPPPTTHEVRRIS